MGCCCCKGSALPQPKYKYVPSSRGASNVSFEAWLPNFSGLQRPKGFDSLMKIRNFTLRKNNTGGCITLAKSTEIYSEDNSSVKLFKTYQNPTYYFWPSKSPVLIYDTQETEVLRLDFEETTSTEDFQIVEVIASSGLIGSVCLRHMTGTTAYEVRDSYNQTVFNVTRNFNPTTGMEFLVTATERCMLNAAIWQRGDDFIVEVCKPLPPTIKALLICLAICVVNFSRSY